MPPQFAIETAKRSIAKARIALCGPSGSGKTYTALELARGLTSSPKRIILIDSENRSAAKYADGQWKQLVLPNTRPETYCEAIAFAQGQADVLIIDSISHAWSGSGGALERAEALQSKGGNKMDAWRQVTPLHNRFVEALVGCSCHLIVTMRTRTEWVFEQSSSGRTTPRKVGLRPIQRDGIEYEFDIVCDLTWSHDLIVSKSRSPQLDCVTVSRPGPDFGQRIRNWLEDAAPEPDVVTPQSSLVLGSWHPTCEEQGALRAVAEHYLARYLEIIASSPDLAVDLDQERDRARLVLRERSKAAARDRGAEAWSVADVVKAGKSLLGAKD